MLTDIIRPELLLVEDSEDDAYFFERALKKSGSTCLFHHVTNGAEAIDYIEKASTPGNGVLPRVVFLDLKMPVLNGFEVLDWLQTQPYASQMRVIVLSGSEHQMDKQRAGQLGAAAYLVKPVKESDLHRYLDDICAEKTKVGAGV